jgi:hypothetical protein
VTAPLVTLAVPCRADEPALGRTLAAAAASWARASESTTHALEVLVCVNGHDGARPRADVRAFAATAGTDAVEIDVDASHPPPLPPLAGPRAVVTFVTRRAGKPLAWNVLRRYARGPVALFADADVSFTPDSFGLLLDALAVAPGAVLASAKTTCAPRAGVFEGIMAAPYGIDFPNLSAQLYAARVAGLPAVMPEDLIEPERWLELVVGRALLVRTPAARVAVRLPGTLADFFRQRVRIEMGKVQLARDYPGLESRGVPQPRLRAALRSLGPADIARLATYLALRTAAHGVAWWRWRRGRTADVWRQAATTKSWDAA